jgi:N-methylhydantoinase B
VVRLVAAAGGNAPAAHAAYVILLLRGLAGGRPFLMSDGIGVGYGARPFADGTDAVYFVAQENYPVEFLEAEYPARLLLYGIPEFKM